MGLQPFAMMLVAGLGSTYAFAQTGSALVDGTRTSTPNPAQAAERRLSPEERGDIFLARKMYREAIDAYMEEALATDDPAFIAKALGVIARAGSIKNSSLRH